MKLIKTLTIILLKYFFISFLNIKLFYEEVTVSVPITTHTIKKKSPPTTTN